MTASNLQEGDERSGNRLNIKTLHLDSRNAPLPAATTGRRGENRQRTRCAAARAASDRKPNRDLEPGTEGPSRPEGTWSRQAAGRRDQSFGTGKRTGQGRRQGRASPVLRHGRARLVAATGRQSALGRSPPVTATDKADRSRRRSRRAAAARTTCAVHDLRMVSGTRNPNDERGRQQCRPLFRG